ncbi:bifunctional diaminohydroxyphosphoribosylaminopyrimidine deaminase/5-amino-6-(5-phosphoribosylamino)uracil reductase RibD [Tistrella sp. BH-R2-4]|uniref:Riboflavin biosynthesis protein RibD n=2 Tax=Geminicoccaceae TaxID=2066434 RepID=A0ABU9YEL0_9PROT
MSDAVYAGLQAPETDGPAVSAPVIWSDADRHHMTHALALAGRGLGRVWPNPAVGCVLVSPDGRVVGRGWTQPGGRPHGEAVALAAAGGAARGATAYVSLEPCAHWGKTPPCADALVAAGVARVVIATGDPDPRVSGRGMETLTRAGVIVDLGLMAAEAGALNAGFFSRILTGRPLVAWKVATTLDGRIATRNGESQWITGPESRAMGHMLRASHDAIMVGVGTALADNPRLTVRVPGLEDRSPVRVVIDSRLKLPLTHALVREAARGRDTGMAPVWLVTRDDADVNRRAALVQAGVEVLGVPDGADGRPDPLRVLEVLGQRGITRVLLEGGGELAASLLRDRLVDRVHWFRAPVVAGGDGLAAARAYGVDHLVDMAAFERLDVLSLGPDIYETYAATGTVAPRI